jgi:uridine phosphorylase
MAIPASELILNPDYSVYHLHLRNGEVAPWVITVGDPGRVDLIRSYLDTVELERRHREFYTVTGRLGSQRITVLATGIGTDNIDWKKRRRCAYCGWAPVGRYGRRYRWAAFG